MAKNKKQHHHPKPAPRRDPLVASPIHPVSADSTAHGWVRAKLVAELLSDAHPGSGAGGGGIDALVARDRHGRPVIWASHVEGVLRDAAQRLRGAEVACAFFGRPGGHQQQALFTSLFAASDPGHRIWRSTARETFDNRAPKDDTLRVVEHVPKGTRFEGRVELPSSDLPLLRRLLQEVDGLGRGRSSGAGRVRLSLTEAPPTARSVGSPTERLVLLLTNLDPLCITATATPDNLIPSLSFVPGRTLLGALAAWLISEGHRDEAGLLVDGSASVSDATPIPQAPEKLTTAEVLPAPLSLQSEKSAGSPGEVPWWAKPSAPIRRLDMDSDEAKDLKARGGKLKRPEEDLFVYRGDPAEPWQTYRPEVQVRLRNGRPKPKQPDPSLFAIEQIAENTAFLCEIRGESLVMARLATALKPVLEGRRWLRVGRAGAPVEVTRLAWSKSPEPVPAGRRAYLTLTSDLLVRDELLRWCTSLDDSRLHLIPDWPADVRVKPVVQDRVAVHGFNGTSRLWRAPAVAIRRGSVFEVEGDGVSALVRRASQGRWIGERTHEGFGRFRLDDALPGIGCSSSTATVLPVHDDLQDAVAATTRGWYSAHRCLARAGGSSDRRPSLSQWLDLVADLEGDDSTALSSRLNPTTAGGRAWRNRDSEAILQELAAFSARDRAIHARFFVRWLRADMRKEAK